MKEGMTAIEKAKEALILAREMIDPSFIGTFEVINEALVALDAEKPLSVDEQIVHLTADLLYIAGIVERGENRKLDPTEPVTKAILKYVKKLEAEKPADIKSYSINGDGIADHVNTRYVLLSDAQQYAESYHAKECARCKEMELDDMRHGRVPFARFEKRSGITNDVGIVEDDKSDREA